MTKVNFHVEELVFNWHVIEACNFRCNYCFAAWTSSDARAVSKDISSRRKLLGEFSKMIGGSLRIGNQIVSCDRVRLNFAGGEPFLLRHMTELVEEAKGLGLRVSFISNGSRISNSFIEHCAQSIDIAGFSVDSADQGVCRRIGREGPSGRQVSLARIEEMVDRFRIGNPLIRVKINTVVCSENVDDNLTEVMDRIRPDRWKVLRVLPIAKNIEPITDDAFAAFVHRHQTVSGMVVEDNDAMTDTYLMIDPIGRFFINGDARVSKSYSYSEQIQVVGLEHALEQIRFRPEKFLARY